MAIQGINALANMEFALYGGMSGANINAPSMYNGYRGNSSLFNTMGYNPVFRGSSIYNQPYYAQADATRVANNQNLYNSNPNVAWNNPAFTSLSSDLDELGDYYIKNSAPSESLMGAAVGGAAFGLMNNMRLLVHPFNSYKALAPVREMFADATKEGTELFKKISDIKTHKVITEAYGQMHRLEGAKLSKHGFTTGLFKEKLTGESLKKAEQIQKQMKTALKTGNLNKIAELSEEARRLVNTKNGYIPRAWRALGLNKPYEWFKGTDIAKKFGVGVKQSTAEAGAKSVTEKAAASTLGGALKHSCGIGNGLAFAGFELAFDLLGGKISAAFEKDTSTGIKQLGQTAIKGVGSAVGWAVGEGIGAWAGLQLGAAIGSVVPGVGTAIGAVAGLIGGSIGCWLTGKLTHKIIGKEAGDVAKVEKMKETAQGQAQLLQLTLEQAQEDKKLNPRTLQAMQNVASFYGASS